jgi:hypothetical protein
VGDVLVAVGRHHADARYVTPVQAGGEILHCEARGSRRDELRLRRRRAVARGADELAGLRGRGEHGGEHGGEQTGHSDEIDWLRG